MNEKWGVTIELEPRDEDGDKVYDARFRIISKPLQSAIAGAFVRIVELQKTISTDNLGYAVFLGVRAGTITVQVGAEGYYPKEITFILPR